MDMQVAEFNRVQFIRQLRGNDRPFLLFPCRLLPCPVGQAKRSYSFRIPGDEIPVVLRVDLQGRGSDDFASQQLKKTPGGGFHVRSSMMGLLKALFKEVFIEFHQFGGFEPASSSPGYFQVVGGGMHGADLHHLQKPGLHLCPDEFCPKGIDVETDVVPHQVPGFFQCQVELLQHLPEGFAIFKCPLGGDAMHLFCGIRNLEPFRPDQKVPVFHQHSGHIMQLPGELNNPWPVFHLFDGGIVPQGQSRGFCIKN